MKKAGAIAATALVVAVVMQAEHESPGATARGAAELRQQVTPVVAEGVGAVGDGVLIARAEAQRQGVNPGALLSPPTTVAQGLPDLDPNAVGN